MTQEPSAPGSAAAWTRFWRSGLTEDIFAGSRTNLERFWFGFVLALPRDGHVLDLATGSGHVARLVARAGDGMRLGLSVTGVDYADIATETVTAATPQHCSLTLMANVRLEALPFADESFDAVTSQFGIEYAERAAAASQIARVLKPGGRGLFVLHHAQSVMTASVRARLDARRDVLGDTPFAQARALFAAHAAGAPPSELAQADAVLREQIAGMRARLGAGFQYENVAQSVRFLEQLAARPEELAPRDALAAVDAAVADSEAWLGRQQAQTRAALDDDGIAAWIAELTRHGVEAEPPLVIGNERRAAVGWRLAIRKPA